MRGTLYPVRSNTKNFLLNLIVDRLPDRLCCLWLSLPPVNQKRPKRYRDIAGMRAEGKPRVCPQGVLEKESANFL